MGKDREGKFHPRKGKPSGEPVVSGLQTLNTADLDHKLEIAEKYTTGEEEPASHLRVRHPNRNTEKGEDRRSEGTNGGRPKKSGDRVKDVFSEAESSILTPVAPEELPSVLTRELFSDLANFRSTPCISIYIPGHASGMEVNEQSDKLTFKSALQEVNLKLKERGIDATAMLRPGHELLRNDNLWHDMSSGLAVFMAEGFFKYCRIPVTPKREILINSSFFVSPLIPLVTRTEYFYLLTVSKKQVRLFRADAFGISHIPVPELPRGKEDVVNVEEKESNDLFRTEPAAAGEGVSFHGAGAGKADEKVQLTRYFDEVDEILWKEVLNREHAPLLLAGVEYLIPLYKSVAKYKPIWPDAITGNHEHENMLALYEMALEKMKPYFRLREEKAIETYNNHSATSLTTSVVEEIIPAAFYGRIATLFAVKDQHLWGVFDEQNNTLVIHERQEEGDACLLDKAVIHTLLNGGEVFLLSQDHMPAETLMAAHLRY